MEAACAVAAQHQEALFESGLLWVLSLSYMLKGAGTRVANVLPRSTELCFQQCSFALRRSFLYVKERPSREGPWQRLFKLQHALRR
jgi:hypothetical protein